MTKPRISDAEFTSIVAESVSVREVIQKSGLIPAGGNYSTTKKRISKLKLDTSHFLGQGANKNKKFGPKRPISDYLSNKIAIQSNKLKKRLINEGLFEHKCYRCQLTKWNNQAIPIELEHIDGNPNNNNLTNLTILCPNCHAQTETYRGKNIKVL